MTRRSWAHLERGAWLLALSQSFAAPLFRVGAGMLALLLFIAPTWHVCALGGNLECHEHGAPSNQTSEYSKPKVLICGLPEVEESHAAMCSPSSHSVGEVCECPESEPSAVATLNSTHSPHFAENCLARLLWNFPAALILFFILFLLWAQRVTRNVSTHTALVSAFRGVFAARGPPVFS